MNFARTRVFALLPIVWSTAASAQVWRAPHYEEALRLAAEHKADIAVLQHGSDWNRLGQFLLDEVWRTAALEKALAGERVVLVAVDSPETPGNPPVPGRTEEDARPEYRPISTPTTRLNALAATPPPSNQVASVKCDGGSTWTRLDSGFFLASGANPHHAVLELTLTSGGGSLFRLDYGSHPDLPANGPGRASNGNFAINEIVFFLNDATRLETTGAWARHHEGGWGGWHVADGKEEEGNLWNAMAHREKQGALFIALAKPIPAGASVTVRIQCRSPWGQHVPGMLRAAILNNPADASDVAAIATANILSGRNGAFKWRGDDVPRVALMDREGRHVDSEDRPRMGLTPEGMAARIRKMIELRKDRDALWAAAESQQGADKAVTLMKSLRLLGLGGSAGQDNAYKFVQDQIRAADASDDSGAQRWLQFQPDSRVAPAMVNEARKLAGEKEFEKAVALLDGELNHPGNKHLTADHRQRILLAKYNIVRGWPGREETRWEVLKQMADLDPNTYLGLGATGHLAMNYREESPSALVYGWGPTQVKPVLNTWNFHRGTRNYFDLPGSYTVRIIHAGGPGVLRIRAVRLLAGKTVLSEALPDADLTPDKPVECKISRPPALPDETLVLQVLADGMEGKTDIRGRFEIEPDL